MNSVNLIGRLTRDPELSYSQNQNAVCRFTLAVDRPFGQDKEKQADFIRIVTFGNQAENCERFLEKGRQVAVTGRIQTGSYQKDGVTVYTTDVIADRVEFIGGGRSEGAAKPVESAPRREVDSQESFKDLGFSAAEDDIPF